jgi:hypothetical protein
VIQPWILRLTISLALAGSAPLAGAEDFPRLPDGRLRAGCDFLSDGPSLATEMEFVGGLQFDEAARPAKPRDPAAAVQALRVGDLSIPGDARSYGFVEKQPLALGFVVRWANKANTGERVALYTSWASLKEPALRQRNIVCRETAESRPAQPAP